MIIILMTERFENLICKPLGRNAACLDQGEGFDVKKKCQHFLVHKERKVTSRRCRIIDQSFYT